MTIKSNKTALDFSQYKSYEIPQEYMAYTIYFNDIDDMQTEELEFEYVRQGYKIFHSELERANLGLFNLTLIVGKCEVTF